MGSTGSGPAATARLASGSPRTSDRTVIGLDRVSTDRTTKLRATAAFAADPALEATIHAVEDDTRVLAAEAAKGRTAAARQREARRRRQRGELDVKGAAGDATIARSVGAGIEAPDEASRRAAGSAAVEATAPGRHKKAESGSDFKLQQLRGIFAAFDENRDGVLTKEELSNALLALGINPTAKAIQKYQMSSHASTIDLPSFIRVSLHKLDGLETTERDILSVFDGPGFDPEGTGKVPARMLRHVLSGVETHSELTASEMADLMRFTGLDAVGDDELVDYTHLVRTMTF